jgi:hypothetical protein
VPVPTGGGSTTVGGEYVGLVELAQLWGAPVPVPALGCCQSVPVDSEPGVTVRVYVYVTTFVHSSGDEVVEELSGSSV